LTIACRRILGELTKDVHNAYIMWRETGRKRQVNKEQGDYSIVDTADRVALQ
jgi:hypothetical protein